MTSAEFAGRYKLLKRITDGGVRSYNAQGSGGRPVMVHFIDSDPGGAQQLLLARLRRLDAPGRGKVVEAVEVDGTPVLVTQFLPGFTSLEEWLESRVPAEPSSFSSIFRTAQPPEIAAPALPAAAPAPPEALDPHAAPTQMMQVPVSHRPAPPGEPPAAPVPAPPSTVPAAGVASSRPERGAEDARLASAIERLTPGEFTRMFSAPDGAAPSPPAAPGGSKPGGPPAAPTPPLARPEPGEFTRLFQSPSPRDESPLFELPSPHESAPRPEARFSAPPAPVTPPAPPAHQRPVAGAALPPMETSRIFDVPLAPPEGGREARSDRIVPLSAAGSPPQSVTGIMGARHAESPPHPPSDMFGFGDAIPVNPAVPAPVVPPPAIQAPIIPPSVIPLPVIPRMPAAPVLAAPSIAAAAGAAVTLGVAAGSAPPPNAPAGVAPSEFTRVLQGVAAPAAAAAVVTGAAIAGQKKKDQQAGRTGPSIVPLVVGLNILLIAAIGLILYFVLAG